MLLFSNHLHYVVNYYELLGMKQINKIENPDNKFDLYFLAYDSPKSLSTGEHWTARQGILELTHNYGTEKDDNFKVANGNSEPGKGFGHICVSVDAIQAACQRIEDAGYKFQKKLTDGRMRHIAFALDPGSLCFLFQRYPNWIYPAYFTASENFRSLNQTQSVDLQLDGMKC